MKTNPNSPINPVYPDLHSLPEEWHGLTVREVFAAMAMQGLMTKNITFKPEEFAVVAIEMADALIKALNKDVE